MYKEECTAHAYTHGNILEEFNTFLTILVKQGSIMHMADIKFYACIIIDGLLSLCVELLCYHTKFNLLLHNLQTSRRLVRCYYIHAHTVIHIITTTLDTYMVYS